MKKLFKLAFLLSGVITYAQQVEVYNYENGIRSLFPTYVIEASPLKTEIYTTTFGIKDLFPTTVIENNSVYKVENGIQQILPIQKFEFTPSLPTFSSPVVIDFEYD